MKNLVVVESPSKTKKLESFLGKDFTVLSSVGHIRDLPKSGLAVDVENNFEPEYVLDPDKRDIISALKKAAKQADAIYLATDPDREGEAIAWHVGNIMNANTDLKDDPKNNQLIANKIKNKDGKNPEVYRVAFHSITKEAVLEAFENPHKLNMNLVGAQQGRRVLDRLVGYKLSPLLWEKIRYGLSAGRVQSVAVRLVAEREEERDKFSKDQYFEIIAEFKHTLSNKNITAPLKKIEGEDIYQKQKFNLFAGEYTASKTTIDSEEKAKKLEKELEAVNEFTISAVEQRETKKHPSPPFTTSMLQQAASNLHGYSPKRTMQLAQKLYEGGYITYMRTDSIHIVQSFVKKIRVDIKKQYGVEYLFVQERNFKGKKGAKTQEAHEAIRPTSLSKTPESLPKSVTPQQRKMYELIYNRTVATQMAPAIYANTTLTIEDSVEKKYTFKAKGSILKFEGYLKVYANGKSDEILPKVKEGELLNLNRLQLEAKEMSAPPRYNESSLVRELEKFGIGRPSTYASIVATIQSRGYVKKQEKALYPTDNGIVVNGLLVKHFPNIVNVDFTAKMEEDLDKVAIGEQNWHDLIREFYGPFEKQLELKRKEIKKEDIVILEKTDESCPECKKGELIVKLGKYGKFLSCDQYPDCKYARPIEGDENSDEGEVDDEELQKLTKDPCPNCGGKLIVKTGRFGKFVACENYPKCKHTKSVQHKINMKCPNCGDKKDGGEIVIKRTKKGRTFYGCSRYPDCDYASWKKPVDENQEDKA